VSDPQTAAPLRERRPETPTPLRRTFLARLDDVALVAGDERRNRAVVPVLGALMLAAAAFFFLQGRGLTFYFDEWAFVIDRREWGLDNFLQPHNEHLHMTAVLAFKLLFVTAGLDFYEPYRIAVLMLHLAVVALTFALMRRGVGDAIALVGAIPLLFLGAGWENIMWPFQIGLLGALAGGLGALLLIERGDARGDVAASVLLALSLASASVAVPIALALAVEIAWRPPRWRRLWVVVVPLALYGLWSVTYGRSALLASNAPGVPRFVADTAAAVVGGLLGLDPEWGRVILLLALIWLGASFVRGRVLVTPRLASLTLALVSSWVLTALARAHLGSAESSRYVYVGAVFVLLIVAELACGARVPARMLAVVAVLVGVSLAGNYALLRGGLEHMRGYTATVEAALVGLELAGPETPLDFRPAPEQAPNIYAGPYFEAVSELGSPAPSVEELLERKEEERRTADAVYVAARGVEPEAASGAAADAPAPEIDEVHWGRAEASGSCVEFVPTAPGAAVDLALLGDALALVAEDNAHVDVHVRMLAGGFPDAPALTVPGESRTRIVLPPPVAGRGWHVRLFATERVRACTAAAG